MSKQFLLQNVAISVTLSCLFFVESIRGVIFPSVGLRSWAVDQSPIEAKALLLLISIGAAVLFTYLSFAGLVPEGRAKTEVRFLFLIVSSAMFGAAGIQIVKSIIPVSGPYLNYILPIVVLTCCLLTSVRNRPILASVESRLRGLLLILSPAALILVLQCCLVAFSSQPAKIADRKDQIEQPSNANSLKVLWILFDEFDFAAMRKRPQHIQMPSFEAFETKSFVAEYALPPAQDTKESIPSLLYGRPFKPEDPDFLQKWTGFDGRSNHDYFRSGESSLVDDLHTSGRTSAVAGWYVPYERLFGDNNTFGEWSWNRTQGCRSIQNCASQAWELAYEGLPIGNPFSVLELKGYSKKKQAADSASQRQRNQFLMAEAMRIIDDERFDLRLVHLSVPHSSYISKNLEKELPDYFDNLEIADANLEQLLSQTAKTSDGDTTTVIVSSDHWLRDKSVRTFDHLSDDEAAAAAADIRIPFMVRFPNSTEKTIFEPIFNTVITRDIINAIFSGEIRSNQDLVSFLNKLIESRPELASYRPDRKPV